MTVRTAVIQPCALRLTPLSHSERAGRPQRMVHDWSQPQETRAAALPPPLGSMKLAVGPSKAPLRCCTNVRHATCAPLCALQWTDARRGLARETRR
jgi:hypothetical protein